MKTRHLLYCLGGLVLGFAVGFYLANRINVPASQTAAVARPAGGGAAGPLDPSQQGGQLPPGHPDISQTASDGSPANPNGAAASNANAQAAMEAADRKPADFKLQLDAAQTFYGLKAYDKAALYLERALKLKPQDADALVLMGNTKYDAGDYAAAESHYERALAVRPADADVRGDLGNTFFQRRPPDYARAIEHYREALKINPSHEIVLQNMASAAIQLGDKAAAEEAVGLLTAANPNNTFLQPLRTRIASMP